MIIVTGCNGLIGAETCKRLIDRGFRVRGTDVHEQSTLQGVDYQTCDVRDFDRVRTTVQGCDVVIHLAALPSPRFASGPVTFDINTTGTFNVFQAAAQAGIKRVVQASSMNATGATWNLGDFVPDRFPVDEDQSITTYDPYSLSKHFSELIGDYFWRRDGISSVALRMPGVFPPGVLQGPEFRERARVRRRYLDEFLSLPEAERASLLAVVRARVLDFRAHRWLEFGTERPMPTQEELGEIPKLLWEEYQWGRYMLWACVDVRDTAQAFVNAVDADYSGSQPIYISDDANMIGYDIRKLSALFYPDVTEWTERARGDDGLISIRRARSVLGFEPLHSVRGLLSDDER